MFDLSTVDWFIASFAALLVGISKTGIPGAGTLAVPLLADVLPARSSTGALLPMLIFGDIFAVAYWRRHAVWPHLIRLMPWALVGVVLGYFALGFVNDRQLRPIIGAIVLILLAVNFWRNRRGNQQDIPTSWYFAAVMGLLAGTTTMMANAAGPIMIVYLLAMRLPKNEFIGTGAWYFLIVNSIKVPFSAHLGLITAASLKFNLTLAPIIAIGALAGIVLVKTIPQKVFSTIVQLLAALAALKLLV